MVLLWRVDAEGKAGPAPIQLDGSSTSDVTKFLFMYENVIMRGKSPEEKVRDILCYLNSTVFEIYYTTFSKDVVLTKDAGNWKEVSKDLSGRLSPVERPEIIYKSCYGSASRSNEVIVIFNGYGKSLQKGTVQQGR